VGGLADDGVGTNAVRSQAELAKISLGQSRPIREEAGTEHRDFLPPASGLSVTKCDIGHCQAGR